MAEHGVAITSPDRTATAEPVSESRRTVRELLLICGILSSLLYAAMLVFIPLQWEGYSSASQAVSELSAIGAPTRGLWGALGVAWTVLYAAFGWGVWLSTGPSRAMRVVGSVIIASALLGLFWPPMHLRGAEVTLTDRLHIVWTMVNGALTLLAMGFGAAAFGKRFRVYSIATMVILLGAGAVTGTYASRVAAGLPTPGMGVWERINIAVWLLWVGVLAVTLLRRTPSPEGKGLRRVRNP